LYCPESSPPKEAGKVKNPTVRVEIPKGIQFRKDTAKGVLVRWAIEKGEFTKEEFLRAAIRLKRRGEVDSKMPDEQMARVWWSVFYNKRHYFKEVDADGGEEQNSDLLAVRITPTLRQSILRASQRSGLTQSDWVRGVLARAAHERAFAPTQQEGGR
jgi:hypothetical protein